MTIAQDLHACPPVQAPSQGAGVPATGVGPAFPPVSARRSRSESRRSRLAYGALALANRLVPKRPEKVALHSGGDFDDGVLAVAAGLAARGLRPTVLLQDQRRRDTVRRFMPPGTRLVPKHSLRGVCHYLTAATVMTTHNVFGNRRPPASQVVVSLWHGEPPGKFVARFEGQDGLRGTYAPVCSTIGRAYRAAEFDMSPLQVPVVGAARNDRMLTADPEQLRRALLGDDAVRRVLLWLPSFRSGVWDNRTRADTGTATPSFLYSLEDLQRLDDWLVSAGALVVVKLHPRDAATFPSGLRAIRRIGPEDLEQQGITLYPALSAFDGLITDVSSVWLDYLLLDKPLIYAFPDLDDYRSGRGLNLEPFEDWVPGPLVKDIGELIAAVADVVEHRDPMREERGRARRRLHLFRDAGSTARLLDGLSLTGRA